MVESSIQVRPEAWSGGESRLARTVARPLARFLAQETASGVLLLVATVAALVWANLPGELGETYHRFWESHLDLTVAGWQVIDKPFEAVVNDALMAVFFFVVGMEIKSELVVGELRDPREAALPAVAALGGMILPALLYVAINLRSDGLRGWGIPMATDIAFAVGVLALLGPRIPSRLKVFLLTLAIVDDIGAILVIAIFYTTSIALDWLALATGLFLFAGVLQRYKVWYLPVYVIVGVVSWYATFRSGVHATIAGVAFGLLTPARPLVGNRAFEAIEDVLAGGPQVGPATAQTVSWNINQSVPVTDRLAAILSPWTSFLIVPLFALANAGLELSGAVVESASTSLVTMGVFVGLVIGKPAGVIIASWLALRSGLSRLPAGITMTQLLGIGAVAGIGFTLSLFVTKLAFDSPELLDEAIVGVFVASVVSAVVGAVLLYRSSEPVEPTPEVAAQ